MAVTSLPHNGAGRVVIPLLAPLREKVDHLAELRQLVRQAQQAERELTGEIVAALDRAGLGQLAGRRAVAIREERTLLRPDPELFLQAVGPRGYEAVNVGVTIARRLMAADDLAAISETTTVAVLRVEPLPANAA